MDEVITKHGTDTFSVVAKVVAHDEFGGFTKMEGLSPIQHFLVRSIMGEIGEIWTMYDYQTYGEVDTLPLVEPSPEGVALPHPQHAHDLLTGWDFCAGIGALGWGANFAGVSLAGHVDEGRLACIATRLNSNAPIIQGDIKNIKTTKQVHQHSKGTKPLIMAGFPCQPFSRQGLQLGEKDPRFQTLPALLRSAWLLGASGLLMECVPEVKTSQPAMEHIRRFAEAKDLIMQDTILELADRWLCRRKRWWALLTPRSLPTPTLQTWPKSEVDYYPHNLISEWPVWPIKEEQQLKWTEQERNYYDDPTYGQDLRQIDLMKKIPTAVHSWGSALSACPCGCRQQGFSERWLRQGGLRGFAVHSKHLGARRFPHPGEVAFWNTIPASYRQLKTARAALAMLGQMAAPMQSAWVTAHLASAVYASQGRQAHTPLQVVSLWQERLLREAADLWVLPSMYIPRSITLEIEDVLHQVQVQHPTTAFELVRAESDLAGWGHRVKLYEGQRELHGLTLLHHNCKYHVELSTKRQRVALQQNQCEVYLHEPGQLQHIRVPQGTFIMHVLNWLGATSARHEGRALPPGSRIWTCLALEISGAGYQGQKCSDDSIYGTLQALLKLSNNLGNTPWTALSPREAKLLEVAPTELLTQADTFRQTLNFTEKLILVFEDEGHWAVLQVTLEENVLLGKVFNGYPQIPQATYTLMNQIGILWGHQDWHLHPHSRFQQKGDNECGAIAIQHVCHILDLWSNFTDEDTRAWHAHLLSLDTSIHAWRAAGPNPDKLTNDLIAVLQQQGVPANAVEQRASAAIKQIGRKELLQALQQGNVWQSLKSLANQSKFRFRWVLPEELNMQVQKRAADRYGASKPSKAGKSTREQKVRAPPVVEVEPNSVILKEGTFIDEDSNPIPQLKIGSIAANARGIAIATAKDLIPFLKENKNISPDALALLTTQVLPDELRGSHPTVDIQYPAIFQETEEAILLRGTLVNIGDVSISKKVSILKNEVEAVETAIIKLSAFKDELGTHWEDFTTTPARAFIKGLDPLNICRTTTCSGNCQKYHPAVEEDIVKVVQDFWGRSYYKTVGGKVEPSDAELVQAYARVPKLALLPLCKESGQNGIYVEPRSEDSLGPSKAFAIIWLPGQSLADAKHHLAMQPKAIGLARLGNKWGLRTAVDDEAALFQVVRPGHTFIQIKINFIFKIYPLPFGIQRAGVQQLLQQWKWDSKPLQPTRGSPAGSAWEIGAEKNPPSFTMPGPSGDVLIVLVRQVGRKAEEGPQAIIPIKTRRFLQGDRRAGPASQSEQPGHDPWQNGKDPWASWFTNSEHGTSHAAPGSTVKKLDELEHQLTNQVKEAVQREIAKQPDMDVDMHNSRVDRLETSISELTSQQQRFEEWFQHAGQRHNELQGQVSSLCLTVEQQQADISQIKKEVHEQPTAIHHAVSNAMQSVQANLQTQLSSQFQMLQDSLAAFSANAEHADKKHRGE